MSHTNYLRTIQAKYQQLKRQGKLTGTIKHAAELAEQRKARRKRQEIDPLTIPLHQRYKNATTVIPLGTLTGQWWQAINRIQCENPRKQNWEAARATKEPTQLRTNNHGRYSSRVRFIKYTYTPLIQSYGVATGKTLYLTFDGQRHTFTAPHGYQWRKDRNGIKLQSNSNREADYHPTVADIVAGSKYLVAKLKSNYKQRQEAAKLQRQQAKEAKEKEQHYLAAIKRAEKEGAMVCFADSIRAGNCVPGTERFTERHHLNRHQHYRPTQLLKLANGDAARVALTITVALKRHKEEMVRGYALLSEHNC